jgi:predicted permease
MYAWGPITVEGRVPPAGEKFINADMRMTSGRYFQAMGIPLLAGRLLDDHDVASAPRVALVDAYMAQQLWPNQDAVGKRIHLGGITETSSPWITVVGVVGQVKQYTLDSESRIALYLPQTQYVTRAMNVVLHSSKDPTALAPALKQQVHELDSDLPLYNVLTMQHRLDESLARRRFTMVLLGLFAAVALVLATIGIYGVMAYLISQGTRDIGIRMALGATQNEILALTVGKGMALALSGAAVGVLGAFAITRLLRGLLFGVHSSDPVTFCTVPLLLILVALLASYIPARRASRIDPATALRHE